MAGGSVLAGGSRSSEWGLSGEDLLVLEVVTGIPARLSVILRGDSKYSRVEDTYAVVGAVGTCIPFVSRGGG